MPEIHRFGSKVLIAIAFAAACGGSSSGTEHPDGGSDGTPPGAPTIVSFEVTPATLPYGGGDVAVSWTVNDATTIELQGVRVTGTSATVTVAQPTTLELRALGPGGEATATRDVAVETTVTILGRVLDETGAPVRNVSYTVLEDPNAVAYSVYDDGTFSVPIRNIVPPYTICLNAPTTCYIGLTRADPLLIMWRQNRNPPPSTFYGVDGILRRQDAAAFSSFSISLAVDGPAPGQGSLDQQGVITSSHYGAALTLPTGIEPPVGRAWAVLQDGTNAAAGHTDDIALVADTTLMGHDIAMASVPTRSVQLAISGPYTPDSLGTKAGLVLPHGAKMTLVPEGGQFAIPAVPGAQMFTTASAFQPGTLTPFSTVTKVGDIVAGTVALPLPPSAFILSPEIGSPITADTEFSWTPLAGAIYRVHVASGVNAVDFVVAKSSTKFPTVFPGWGVNCGVASCAVSIDTYGGGFTSLDDATDGALRDVLRGARSGSVTPGPLVPFSH